MSRIEDILIKARYALLDSDKVRWSDTVLLSILDEGQKDIARQTNMLKDIIIIFLVQNQHTYTLPVDTLSVLRCVYDNKLLPLRTMAYMDQRHTTGSVASMLQRIGQSTASRIFSRNDVYWMSTTGNDILLAIYDKLKRRDFRVWPIPIAEAEDPLLELDSPYGIITEISEWETIVESYGLIGTVIDTESADIVYSPSIYGELSGYLTQKSISIQRSKMPATLVTVLDELEVDELCDDALKHYVIGKALRQDTIVENRVKGSEELTFYGRDLDMIKALIAGNSVSIDHHDTFYNPMGA